METMTDLDRYVQAWDTGPSGKVESPENFDRLENGKVRRAVYTVLLLAANLLQGCPARGEEQAAVSVPDIHRYRLDSLDIDDWNRPQYRARTFIV